MDEPLLVIVGEWECNEKEKWHFRVSTDKFAKCVELADNDSYEDLKGKVIKAFGIDPMNERVHLTFWCEAEEVVFTQKRMPPVSIECNSGLTKFKKKRFQKTGLNMYLTIIGDSGSGVRCMVEEPEMTRRTCGEAEGDVVRRRVLRTVDDGDLIAALAREEAAYKRTVAKGFSDDVKLTYEDEGFIDAVEMVERDRGGLSVDEVGDEDVLVTVDQLVGGVVGNTCDDPSQDSVDYDFDKMRTLIDTDYPDDWDPVVSACRNSLLRGGQFEKGECSSVVRVVDFGPFDSGSRREVRAITETLVVDKLGSACVPVDTNLVNVVHRLESGNCEPAIDNNLVNVVHPLESQSCRPVINNNLVDVVHPTDVAVDISEDVANLTPIGFSLGIESQELADETGVIEGGDEYALIRADDPLLTKDTASFRDNIGRAPKDTAHMNLRKAGDAIYVGRVFKNKSEMHKALSVYSIKRLFNFRIKASDRKRVIANCDDPKCRWRIYATYHKDSETLEIRTATLKHTCDVETRSQYGKKATAKILGELLKGKYAHGKRGPRACELPEMVLSELNVTISYIKAWNSKELAMKNARGNEEENYKFLRTYLHLLKLTNPGTLSTVHTTFNKGGDTLFKYLFFAFGASVSGYKHLRKVIVIDGTQTKGKYRSCLVAASGQDGNYQIFPLAFGVVDGENIGGWTWFFKQLSQFVPDEEELVFISDRHAAIYAGLRTVYPLAKHGACSVHLFRNVKHNFHCEGLAGLVSKASRAYTVGEFRYWFAKVEEKDKKCANYLLDIGLQHWTLAYFPRMRYNLMSSNISESLNAAIQKDIDFPIVTMIEFIRTMLMRWFCERREIAAKTETKCTPEIEALLVEHLHDAVDCAVISASEWIYQVNDSDGCAYGPLLSCFGGSRN